MLRAEVSQRTRVPEGTLKYWRHQGTGPKSFKVGRRVLYRESDVETWLEQQAADSTPPAA